MEIWNFTLISENQRKLLLQIVAGLFQFMDPAHALCLLTKVKIAKVWQKTKIFKIQKLLYGFFF